MMVLAIATESGSFGGSAVECLETPVRPRFTMMLNEVANHLRAAAQTRSEILSAMNRIMISPNPYVSLILSDTKQPLGNLPGMREKCRAG